LSSGGAPTSKVRGRPSVILCSVYADGQLKGVGHVFAPGLRLAAGVGIQNDREFHVQPLLEPAFKACAGPESQLSRRGGAIAPRSVRAAKPRGLAAGEDPVWKNLDHSRDDGSTLPEIGNGFRPCTRTARLYDFPNEAECLLRFLDTRGLGEAEYDPAEDIQFCEDQAHLLIVVIKAADQAPQPLLAPLTAIRKAHPNWPVIVAQTGLHELYPPGGRHIVPYPYGEEPLPAPAPSTAALPGRGPSDLLRSLAAQREWFGNVGARLCRSI